MKSTNTSRNREALNRAKILWLDTAIRAQWNDVDIRPWLPSATSTAREIENLAEGMRQAFEGKELYKTGE